jgi:hypothetical protein
MFERGRRREKERERGVKRDRDRGRGVAGSAANFEKNWKNEVVLSCSHGHTKLRNMNTCGELTALSKKRRICVNAECLTS